MHFKDTWMEKYEPEEWQVVIKIVDLSEIATMVNYCTGTGFFARWHGVGEKKNGPLLVQWGQ